MNIINSLYKHAYTSSKTVSIVRINKIHNYIQKKYGTQSKVNKDRKETDKSDDEKNSKKVNIYDESGYHVGPEFLCKNITNGIEIYDTRFSKSILERDLILNMIYDSK